MHARKAESKVKSGSYRGPATCTWAIPKACDNPARWMPVLTFALSGPAPLVEAALLDVGVCDACKGAAAKSLATDVASDMVQRMFRGGARFERLDWVQVALAC